MTVELQDLSGPLPSVATIGFFDGVHLGHRSIIDRLVATARSGDLRSVVVTFDPHPRVVLSGSSVSLLTSVEEKTRLLQSFGVHEVVVVPFTRALSQMSPREFLEEIMIAQVGLTHLIVGYDHAIGKDASGDADTIVELGSELGFQTDVIGPTQSDRGTISSSSIRHLLTDEGDVALASRQLGRPYTLRGTVVVGDGRGRQIGFPTANLALANPDKVVPANGVYAVQVRIGGSNEHSRLNGVMNVGVRPTVTSSGERVLEVHILDFERDLYGQLIEVSFIERIRAEQRFSGIDELKRQIAKDTVDCMRIHEAVSLSD